MVAPSEGPTMSNNARARARFIRQHQLQGGTYAQAVEIWNAADEIADTFDHDGIRTAEGLSDGAIRDAIADWHAVRKLGL